MKLDFTVITPTGDRAESLRLCIGYMARQTLKPAEWLVIDDGQQSMLLPELRALPFVRYVKRAQSPGEPSHTLSAQMAAALKLVRTDYAMIMEDDDWYAPDYCQKIRALFDDPFAPELVGQGQTVYYHVPSRQYFVHDNKYRASWCQTGFRKSLIPDVIDLCADPDPFIDLRVWDLIVRKIILVDEPRSCIGIKGMRGRAGASGHESSYSYKPDPDLCYLKELIGEDIKFYRNYLGEVA